jgi:hypothetical protein
VLASHIFISSLEGYTTWQVRLNHKIWEYIS